MKLCFFSSCRFNLTVKMEEFGESDSLNLSPAQRRHLEKLSGQDITKSDVDDIFRDYGIAADEGEMEAATGERVAGVTEKRRAKGQEADSGSAKRTCQGEGSQASIKEVVEFIRLFAES